MSSFKKFSSEHPGPAKPDKGDKPRQAPAQEKPVKQPPKKALADSMIGYGITRVPVDYYHFQSYRYTNLDDAVAQAKRSARA